MTSHKKKKPESKNKTKCCQLRFGSDNDYCESSMNKIRKSEEVLIRGNK